MRRKKKKEKGAHDDLSIPQRGKKNNCASLTTDTRKKKMDQKEGKKEKRHS